MLSHAARHAMPCHAMTGHTHACMHGCMPRRYFMENVCDRMLELDRGKCFMHNFGGAGSYEEFKEVRCGACALHAHLPCAACDAAWGPPYEPCILYAVFQASAHGSLMRLWAVCSWRSGMVRMLGWLVPCRQSQHTHAGVHVQAREARRRAQANAAADARTLFRKEAEWMSRQPKARSVSAVRPEHHHSGTGSTGSSGTGGVRKRGGPQATGHGRWQQPLSRCLAGRHCCGRAMAYVAPHAWDGLRWMDGWTAAACC